MKRRMMKTIPYLLQHLLTSAGGTIPDLFANMSATTSLALCFVGF